MAEDEIAVAPAANQDTPETECVIKLRGLPFAASEKDIVAFFEGYDVLADSVIFGVDTFRARPNGEAFVKISTADERERAVAGLDRKQIGSRYIELFRSSLSDYQQAKRKAKGVDDAEHQALEKHVFTEGPDDAVIRLRGLPYQATVDDIVEFFNGFQLPAGKDSVRLVTAADGRVTGEGYVQLASLEDMQAGVEKLNKQHIRSRYVELFPSSASEARKAIGQSELARKKYESDGEDVTVHVRGLPFSVNYHDVRQFFAPAQIMSKGIHLLRDGQGRASGEAYVVFVTAEDAKQGLAKHREMLENRYIEVTPSSRTRMVQSLQLNAAPMNMYMYPGQMMAPQYGARGGAFRGGYGQARFTPYQQPNAYAQQQNPYAQQAQNQNPYLQQTQNPYVQQPPNQNPYVQQLQNQSSFAQPAQNPYAQGQQPQTAYGLSQPAQNVYAQAQPAPTQNPYTQAAQNPYTQVNQMHYNPYSTQPTAQPANTVYAGHATSYVAGQQQPQASFTDGNTSMGYGGVTAAYSGYEAVPGMAQWSYGTSNIS